MVDTLEEKPKAVPKPTKAIVKEFFDLDAVLKRHLLARLPFFSNSDMKINPTFKSKDKTVHRFRVNWTEIETGKIRLSQYIELIVDLKGHILQYNTK